MQKLIFTNDVVLALRDEIAAAEADKVFVLADKNTCLLYTSDAADER